MFNAAAGVKTLAVTYKGAAPTLIALASGEVGFSVLNLLDPQPFVKQGKIRSLAVTGAKRSVTSPDVPTPLLDQLAEGGQLLVPVGGRDEQVLLRIRRTETGFVRTRLDAMRFVPLIGTHGFEG
jgi:hypothetical protein